MVPLQNFQEMGGVKMDGMEEAAEAAEEVSKGSMTSYDLYTEEIV